MVATDDVDVDASTTDPANNNNSSSNNHSFP